MSLIQHSSASLLKRIPQTIQGSILTISLGQLGLKTGQKLQTIKKIQNPKTRCACPMMMMISFLFHDELTTPTWV